MTLKQQTTGDQSNINIEVMLLELQSSITDGEWFELGGRDNYTIEFTGITDSTLEIRCSNDFNDLKPNSEHGSLVGAAITANAHIQMDANVKFIKVRKTIAGTDTVTAILRA